MNDRNVLAKNTVAGFSSVYAILLLLTLLAVVVWFDPTLFKVSGWRYSGADAAREQAFGVTRVAADRQARLVEGARELLVGLAQLPAARRGDSAACNAYLSALLRRNPGYVNLGAMKPDGEVVCSAGSISDSSSLADRPFVRHAIETRDFAISEYRLDRSTKQAILSFAYPVLNGAGHVQAIVFAGLELAWTAGLLVESQLPQGSAIVVVDQDGTILARYPDSPQWVGTSVLSTPIFRTILEQRREGTAEGRGHDGVQRLFGCRLLIRSSRGREIYVVVTIPRLAAPQIARLGLLATLAIAAIWISGDMALRRRVKRLVSATDRLRLGDLSARTGLRYRQGPMGRLTLAFDDMAAALEAERAETDHVKAALHRLNEALEQEARRIAHALHDEAGQLLAVVYIGLEDCARDLPPATQARLQEIKGHLDQVEEQLRRFSHELRPTILDNLGVVPALQFLVEGVSKRTGLAITVEGGTEGRLPVTVETALYRVVQEGLTNAAKHAHATHVRIQLQREGQQIRCAVLDNGVGFDFPAVSAKTSDRGLGLIGIQERLKGLNGELQITSTHGQGTALRITIPLGA